MNGKRWLLALLASSGPACSSSSSGNPLQDGGADGGGCSTLSVQVDPTAIDFGRVIVHSSVTQLLRVANTSDCPVTLSPIVPQGNSASLFSVAASSNQYTTPIPPGGVVTFPLSFSPTQPSSADETAYLTVSYSAGAYVNVGLKGFAVASGLCISTGPVQTSPPSLTFGHVPVSSYATTQYIYIENCSNEPLRLDQAYLDQSDGNAFALGACPAMANCQEIKPGDGSVYTLNSGDRLTYPITFSAHQAQGYIGEFSVQDDQRDNVIIPITGGGGGPAIRCQTMPPSSPLALDFGQVVFPDGGATLPVICTNSGNDITLHGKVDPSAELQVSQSGLTSEASSFSAKLYLSGLATQEVSLRAGQQFVIQVSYDPTAVTPVGQAETGTLHIACNAPLTPSISVPLSGVAVPPTH